MCFITSTEEECGLSLQDVLMFATGLKEIPPAKLTPQPQLTFQKHSRFPEANESAQTHWSSRYYPHMRSLRKPWIMELKTPLDLVSFEVLMVLTCIWRFVQLLLVHIELPWGVNLFIVAVCQSVHQLLHCLKKLRYFYKVYVCLFWNILWGLNNKNWQASVYLSILG